MAGKFNYTCNNGSKEMAGKSATTHGSAEAKNGGKILRHVRRVGKMAGKSETNCIRWRKQRMVVYVLPELAASWTRGLKVWTLVQVAVGSTHHLGVLQVALHMKQISRIG